MKLWKGKFYQFTIPNKVVNSTDKMTLTLQITH